MKGSERVPPNQRIPRHGAGYLLFPARWWKACTRAPSSGHQHPLRSLQKSGKLQNKTKSYILICEESRGINENYWAFRGAGYQEKPTQLPPVLVGATRQWEPGNQMSADKQLSNPSSHFQFTSLKPSAFNNLHTGELKAEQRIHVPQCRDLPKPGRCHDLLPA